MRTGFVPGNNPRHGLGMFAGWCCGLDFRARRGGYVVLPEFWRSNRTTQACFEPTFPRRPIVNNLLSVPRQLATNVFNFRSGHPTYFFVLALFWQSIEVFVDLDAIPHFSLPNSSGQGHFTTLDHGVKFARREAYVFCREGAA